MKPYKIHNMSNIFLKVSHFNTNRPFYHKQDPTFTTFAEDTEKTVKKRDPSSNVPHTQCTLVDSVQVRPSLGPTASATRVGFPRSFVESLGLEGERLALVHQVVQLLPPLQHGLYGVVQNNFGVVQVCL